jgi:hypothetical protein
LSVTTILERNLLALSSCDPSLSVLCGSVKPNKDIAILNTKNGYPIPAQIINGTPIPFHSKIDPIREAEKYLNVFDGSGYIVFLGLGAGYHIAGFLAKNEVSNILIIDRDTSVFRAILEEIDITSIIADPRVKILIDAEPEAIADHILGSYFPVIAGSLKTISLGARINIEKEYFQRVVDGMKNIIEAIVDDYSVQAQFGRRWFANTLRNLRRASKTTVSIPPVRKAIVTGAGPSLEVQLERVRELAKDAYLIATDTSLPALVSRNIIPNAVISIDCQQISYHHFLNGIPADIPLVLDLASPPLLSNLSRKVLFFSSGHPFSGFISKEWRRFPNIDTTGGNVAHAALSLASSLGASEIYLAGTDFSYPDGKTYARGTYIYPLFQAIQNRTKTMESLFYSFIFNNKSIVREKIGGKNVYSSHTMLMYKKKLESAIDGMTSNVIPLQGFGLPLSIRKSVSSSGSTQRPFFAQGPQSMDWKAFLEDYSQRIALLPDPVEPVSKYLFNLSFEEREIWMTLLPLATWIKEYSDEKDKSGTELLSYTREYAIDLISLVLANAAGEYKILTN